MLFSLKEENINSFDLIFEYNWQKLYHYAYNILRNKVVCEEIVQEAFFSLWNKRQELQITTSLQAYLFTIVKYQILNHIRAQKIRTTYANNYAAFESALVDNSNEENICLSDLKDHFEKEVSKLPEKCQQIFRMSRNEHHSIKNISELLNLSHKTVENQLSKALKHLRTSLGDFLMLFFVPIFSLQVYSAYFFSI